MTEIGDTIALTNGETPPDDVIEMRDKDGDVWERTAFGHWHTNQSLIKRCRKGQCLGDGFDAVSEYSPYVVLEVREVKPTGLVFEIPAQPEWAHRAIMQAPDTGEDVEWTLAACGPKKGYWIGPDDVVTWRELLAEGPVRVLPREPRTWPKLVPNVPADVKRVRGASGTVYRLDFAGPRWVETDLAAYRVTFSELQELDGPLIEVIES